MFCERCGFQLGDDQRFCSSCGKPVGLAIVPLERQGKVERNLQVLAVLWFVAGAFDLLVCIGLVIAGSILFSGRVFIPGLGSFLPFARAGLAIVGTLFVARTLLSFFSGWGLLERHSWARTVAIVAACLELIHFPFGTALGVYTLWVLLPGDASEEYDRLARAA